MDLSIPHYVLNRIQQRYEEEYAASISIVEEVADASREFLDGMEYVLEQLGITLPEVVDG